MRSPETIAATIRAGIKTDAKILLYPQTKVASDKILQGIAQVNEPIKTIIEDDNGKVRIRIEKEE